MPLLGHEPHILEWVSPHRSSPRAVRRIDVDGGGRGWLRAALRLGEAGLMNQVVASHEGEPGARRNDSRADRAHGSTHVTRWHDHRLHSRAALETSVSASGAAHASAAGRSGARSPGIVAHPCFRHAPLAATHPPPSFPVIALPHDGAAVLRRGALASSTRGEHEPDRGGQAAGHLGSGVSRRAAPRSPRALDGSLVECPVVDDDRQRSTHETLDPPGGLRRTDDNVHTPHEPTERAPGGRTGPDPRDVR